MSKKTTELIIKIIIEVSKIIPALLAGFVGGSASNLL